jgi:CDP-4-dehydro-6-deoxyglucose reductase
MKQTNNNRKIYLYRGMRFKKDLYQSEVIDDWYSSGLDISVFNVFSDEEVDGKKKKLVHQQVLDDYQGLHDFQVYCCGAPGMIETAYHSFIEYGLQDSNFFSDAFTFAPK